MASNGQKEKIGDDALTGNGRPIDPDIEGNNHNEETRDQNHGEKDIGQTGDAPKNADQGRYGRTDAYGGTRK
ncbi:hypothetical protein ACSBR2_026646 [Camellia fascicularis]